MNFDLFDSSDLFYNDFFEQDIEATYINILCKKGEFKCKAYFQNNIFDVNIGKNGITDDKTEGDLSTPVGNFQLEDYIFYKNDTPNTKLKTIKLQDDYKWCDDSQSKIYNQFFVLNDETKEICRSYEDLLRADHLYDYILPIKYNDNPAIPNKGSAIFVHVKRDENAATAGCVAFEKEDLLSILEKIHANSRIDIIEKD